MKTKKYNWLARLIDRITKKEQPNNDYFEYYNHLVTLQSGTRDFVDVYISDRDYCNQINFSFDYWTYDLAFFSYNDYDERDAIIKAFRKFYGEIDIKYDEPWEEAVKEYEQYLDPEEYDQDKIRPEYDAIMARKAA